MTYTDLRPNDVRAVEALVDGTWLTGDLEATQGHRAMKSSPTIATTTKTMIGATTAQ